jgi:hypothetical protein
MSTEWQKRVHDEKTDLDARCTALVVFMRSPEFKALSFRQQDLLERQASAMHLYSAILFDRLGEPA